MTISIHSLFKAEHPVIHQIISLRVGIIRVGMVTVEKLDDMESAAVDIKVDIALFKIRRDGLPNLHLRIHPLDLAPCCVPDTLAVDMGRNKEQV